MAAIKFWDGLIRKQTFDDQDKLLIGNISSNGVNYSNAIDLKNYIAEGIEDTAPQSDDEVFE